jgi:hypothetical protein
MPEGKASPGRGSRGARFPASVIDVEAIGAEGVVLGIVVEAGLVAVETSVVTDGVGVGAEAEPEDRPAAVAGVDADVVRSAD